MPAKVDSRIVANMGKQLKDRKEGHSKSMQNVLSGYGGMDVISNSLMNFKTPSKAQAFPIRLINLKLIKERKEGNFFEQSNIGSLKESIRACGLIDPIQLLKIEEGYQIIAGHRRFTAYSQLHEENEDLYKTIPAIVYQLTDDEDLNLEISENKDFVWITQETEERIYEDSNLESRQLTYSEVARYVLHIMERLDDEEYRAKILENSVRKNNTTNFDRPEQICKILESYNYSGWSVTSLKRFVRIYDTSKYSDFVKTELNKIVESTEENKVAIATIYKRCNDEINLFLILNAPIDSKKNFSGIQNKWRNGWKSLAEVQKKSYFESIIDEYKKIANGKAENKNKSNISFNKVKKEMNTFLSKESFNTSEINEIKQWILKMQEIVQD